MSLSKIFTSKHLLQPLKKNQQCHLILGKQFYQPSLTISDAFAQKVGLIYDTKLRSPLSTEPINYMPKEWKNSDVRLLRSRQKLNSHKFNSEVETFEKAELESFHNILSTYKPVSQLNNEITLNTHKEETEFWSRKNDELLIDKYVQHRANLFFVQKSFPGLTIKNLLDRLDEFYTLSFSWTRQEDVIFMTAFIQFDQNWSKVSEHLSKRDSLDCKIYFFMRKCSFKTVKNIVFSEEENKNLLMLVKNYGTDNWSKLKARLDIKKPIPELKKQYKILSNNSKGSHWETAEISKLCDLMNCEKYQSWATISKKFNSTRSAKELSVQWLKINPHQKNGNWSVEETNKLNELFFKFKDWPKVSYHLKTRTAQECQYQWALQHTKVQKKL